MLTLLLQTVKTGVCKHTYLGEKYFRRSVDEEKSDIKRVNIITMMISLDVLTCLMVKLRGI